MSTGYLPPRFETLRAAFVAKWKLKFGNNADTSSDQVDGLFIDLESLFQQIAYEGLGEVYNQHNLGTATGLNVDAILAPTFNIRRLQATPTTSEIWLYGDVGTIVPTLTPISTSDTGSSFQTSGAVTIAAGTAIVFLFESLGTPTTFDITIQSNVTEVTTEGTASQVAADVASELLINDSNVVTAVFAGLQPDGKAIVFVTTTSSFSFSTEVGEAYSATVGFAQSTEDGPVSAAYGTLTRIGETIDGWVGLVNVVDATPGLREETDAAYKTRHAQAIRGLGKATPRAVSQMLLALTGVNAVKLYQNTSNDVIGGRQPHSWEFVVDGGDADLIAEMIWLGHTFGTQSVGNQSMVVVDDQGLVEQPRDILFSRPNYRYVHVSVVILRGEGFPLLPLADIPGMVGAALETWGNTLGIGRDVYLFEVGAKIGAILPGIFEISIYLASTASPLSLPSFAAANLSMAELDYSRWAASRVAVNVV